MAVMSTDFDVVTASTVDRGGTEKLGLGKGHYILSLVHSNQLTLIV